MSESFYDDDKLVGTLVFYNDYDMKLALNGQNWMSAMWQLDQWLRSKVKYESGLEDKKGEELEHYVDAYCTVREELFSIMRDNGVNFDE